MENIDPEVVDQVDESTKWLVTTSSDGFIKIWSFDSSKLDQDPSLISQVDSTCRPTCLAVWTRNHQNTTSNFDVTKIPELKISKEELLVCKEKINEKKVQKKKAKELSEKEAVISSNPGKRKSVDPVKSAKKSKTQQNGDEEDEVELAPAEPDVVPHKLSHSVAQDDEEDDDDDEAIQSMKPNNSLNQINKFKKKNKRNMKSFKQRLQQKKLKSLDSQNDGPKEKNRFKSGKPSSKPSKRDSKPGFKSHSSIKPVKNGHNKLNNKSKPSFGGKPKGGKGKSRTK